MKLQIYGFLQLPVIHTIEKLIGEAQQKNSKGQRSNPVDLKVYDYNSSLIKTKEINDRYFKQYSITFTKGCFVSSVFDTGPVILENLFKFRNPCYHLPLD